MRRIGRWGGVAVVALGVMSLGAVAGFAQDKTAVIKQRQDLMKAQAKDLKAVVAYAKGQGPQAAALDGANDLASRASQIVALFPDGTSSTDFPGKTYAKPAIWQEHAKFAAIAQNAHDLDVKLADAIKGGDPKAVGPAVAALGKNGCGACHGAFREKMPNP